jgi:peroxin-5
VSSVWEELQKSDSPPTQENLAKWEAEFNQMTNSNREELDDDIGADMQNAWEGGIGDFREDVHGESVIFDDDGLPVLGEYVFGTSNSYSPKNILKFDL